MTTPVNAEDKPCQCHQSWAFITPTHRGHCCFVPASQTCHPEEIAEWGRKQVLRAAARIEQESHAGGRDPIPASEVGEAIELIVDGFQEPIPATQLNAAVRAKMVLRRLAEGDPLIDHGDQPATKGTQQSVTISCETTALTTLPDALLDDDAISPMAKMAYWYLKRHSGDVLVSDIARALRMDQQNPWVLLIELGDAGWITYPTIAQRVGGEDGGKARQGPRFTVHEVPAVKR